MGRVGERERGSDDRVRSKQYAVRRKKNACVSEKNFTAS